MIKSSLLYLLFLLPIIAFAQPGLDCGINGSYTMPNNTTAQNPVTLCANNSPTFYTNSDVDGDGCEDVDYSVENNTFFSFTGIAGTGCINYDFTFTPTADLNLQATIFPSNSNTCGCSGLDGANSVEYGGGVSTSGNSYTLSMTICEGETVTIMTDGYGGDTDGSYTIEVSCPCTPPAISASSATDPICPGGSSVLTASGGSSYTWSPSQSLSSSTGNSVTATPTSTTTYTVTGDDGSGCSGTATVTVNVSSLPTPDAGPDVTLCLGQSTTIGADPVWNIEGDDYSWDNSAGSGTIDLSGGGQDNGTAIVSPSSSTTYTLTVTNSSGCTGQDQVLVDVISVENATFSLTDFCEGSANSATGIATSGGTFSLNPNPGGGVSINSSTGEISGGVPGTTYTVEYTTNGSCPGTSTQTVSVIASPIPDAGPDVTMCDGSSVTIGADPVWNIEGDDYSWDNGAGSGTLDLSGGGQDHGTVNVSPGSTTTYTLTVSNSTGCSGTDQVEVIVISSITPTFDPIADICNGDALGLPSTSTNGITGNWSPGIDNTQTTTYTFTPDPGQCATTIDITVIVHPIETSTTNITICDDLLPYSWNGLTFNSAGSQTATLSSTAGCDSLATLNLTVNPEVSSTTDITICDDLLPYSWNGLTFNSTGSQTATLSSTAGCDSLATLNLTVNPEVSSATDITICDNLLPFSWNGLTFNAAGSQTATLSSASGCDSLATLNLTVNPEVSSTTDITICDDILPYSWNGLTFNSAGSQTATLSSASGCDSLATLNLTVNPEVSSTTDITICDDLLPYSWNGLTFNAAGSQTATLSSAAGCDSLATLNLIVNTSISNTDIQTACDSYTWIDGNTYTTSNNSATVMLSTSDGCDSLVTLDLSINNSYNTTDIQGACDSYTWIDGNTYTTSNNTATMMLTSIAGCDSLVTLDLTIDNSLTGTDVQTACDSYTWIDGITYTSSNNTATVLLTASGGCDSLVTLDLTIGTSNTGIDVQTACDSYTWIDGNTYTTSNNSATWTLTNASGCDSTVTLDLTITNSNTGTDVQTACDSYTWIDGNTYTTSNNSATWTLTNASGCDSTVTLDLTITNSNTGTDVQTACDSYTWIDGNTYTTSNNSATWTLTNASGCDSTVTLDLTINNTPSFTVSGTDPSVCNANDGSITISGLNPSTDYTLSYDSLSVASQIITITTDASGEYVISGLLAGLYGDFNIELNGCSFTLNQTVDLNNPGAPIIDNQSSLTECDTYTLADITGSNLSGNESYYTEANGGGTPLNAGDVISATQTIYIYDILGTCADESSFTITVDYTPSLTDPGPQDSCESYFLPLNISGTNLSGNENYYSDLQNNGGTVIVDAITSSQTVYIYDANGACSNEISFEITINELPTLVSFTGEGTYCEGEAVDNLFAEVSGTPDYTLEYTLDGNPLSITSSSSNIDLGNTEGVYVLTALTDNSCDISLSETQTININTTPDTPIVGEDASYCSNIVPADIEASGSTGSYSWYSDASLSDLIGTTQSYTPSVIMGSTSYYVTVTENGCEGLPAEVSITFENCEIIIPTAFTPDDDQINDTWELLSIDTFYPKNIVNVYNRWGNKIYESDQGAYNQRPWTGIYNDKKLPTGSYYFIIEFNDTLSENLTGIVSILK